MISIAMTTYNGQEFIIKQIESILNQTYKDFELIICDDCSTDNTLRILDDYVKKDSRIHLYTNVNNIGFKKNFEKAISLCSGDYIALSDQDDIWVPQHLEVLLNNLGNNYVSCGDAFFIDSSDNFFKNKKKLSDYNYDMNAISSNIDNLKRIIFRGNPYQGASMLLSKDFLRIAMPIPEKCPYHDVWFALVSTMFNKFSYTPEIVNNYRLHEKSVTSHKEKNLLKKIVSFPRFSKTLQDRLGYLDAISTISKTYSISEDVKMFIAFGIEFFKKINNRIYRIKISRRFKKDILNVIYINNSSKYCFYKYIQFLLF